MDEFELIDRYFSRPPKRPETRLGVGDDGAVMDFSGRCCVVTDTLVGGRHFGPDAVASDVGWKALAVNLSDLAAMGSTPVAYTLALSMPEVDEDWLEGFRDGLFAQADAHDMDLIGGDTTRGPLSITITAFGNLDAGTALRRDGAKVGDNICVSGALGAAGLAWRWPDRADEGARRRLARPQARVELGRSLVGRASAAIDLSDGLCADLTHLLAASGVGATLHYERIPAAGELDGLADAEKRACVLAGGEDYELCYTIASTAAEDRHIIGEIEAEPGLRIVDAAGQAMGVPSGFRHF